MYDLPSTENMQRRKKQAEDVKLKLIKAGFHTAKNIGIYPRDDVVIVNLTKENIQFFGAFNQKSGVCTHACTGVVVDISMKRVDEVIGFHKDKGKDKACREAMAMGHGASRGGWSPLEFETSPK